VTGRKKMRLEFWEKYPDIFDKLQSVKKILIKEADKSYSEIRGTLNGIISAGGKMLRPGFFIICTGFGKIEREKLLNMAAAIELLHMATLIHDDVIDDSEKRRGFPTINSVHGKKKAVLTGDYLFTRCFALVSAYARRENIRLLSDTLSEICNSEIRQSTGLFDKTSTFLEYMRRIRGKTAALFSMSFFIGGFESDCDPTILKHLKAAGYYTGIAFQIIDDILDYDAGNEKTGKPVFKDISEGNFTLPLIFALKDNAYNLGKILEKKKFKAKDLITINGIIKESGSIEKSRSIASRYSEKALSEIEKIPENENKVILKSIINELSYRKY
jgi:heptaprenyl diphosphate synthase